MIFRIGNKWIEFQDNIPMMDAFFELVKLASVEIMQVSDEIVIKAEHDEHKLSVHILKHPPSVDNGYISFRDYIHQQCDIIVKAMYLYKESEKK